jgi:protein arginine kinase activator
MFCDNCKENEASVHYQEIINGKTNEIHLCEKCAGEKGMIAFTFQKPTSVENLIAGFLDEEDQGITSEKDKKAVKVRCKCGWTNVDFRKTGYLGCPLCYSTFKKSLTPLLRRIHGNNKHIGKIPGKIPVKEKIVEKNIVEKDINNAIKLKEKLQVCIKEERYEEAAKIRDEIKALENKDTGE